MRDAQTHALSSQHAIVAAAIRRAFGQPNRAQACDIWRYVADKFESRWPKLATLTGWSST